MRLYFTLLTKEFDLDTSVWDYMVEFFYNLLYVYSVSIMVSYLALAILSFISVRKYLHKNSFVDYKDILNTNFAPSVSILAPAYNEGATIIENVRSILSIHYSNFEVIIINDGSKDDTLQKCIDEYDMVLVDYAIDPKIETKPIRGIYKSRNKAFGQLLLVDKENGGKSDALNVGLNVATYDYVTCIDVDCVLEQDALLKLMKPFMDEQEREVVATGGVIRIANSCVIEDGRLLEVKVPENYIARSQSLEYIRAFLLGRMAWSLMDGLILISGALGVFNKKIAIEVGGYDHDTVGEDMELVVRMRRFMLEQKRKYTVAFIPDPLCWTECPETWNILGRQRNRWTRGTIETLWKHRGMLFNPKYKMLGSLSYPYWLLFEYLAPLLEAFGLSLFFLLALVGLVNWSFFMLMMFLVFGFSICFSVLSLLIEEITYHNYTRKRDLLALLKVGLIEPLIYHPFIVHSAVMGNIDYFMGRSSWGEMTRKGFNANAATKPKTEGEGAVAEGIPDEKQSQPKKIQVVKTVAPSKKNPKINSSFTTWATGAVAVLALCLYLVIDLDALLTKDELTVSKQIKTIFLPEQQASKIVVKKERDFLKRTLERSLEKQKAAKEKKEKEEKHKSISEPVLLTEDGGHEKEINKTAKEKKASKNATSNNKETPEKKKSVETKPKKKPEPIKESKPAKTKTAVSNNKPSANTRAVSPKPGYIYIVAGSYKTEAKANEMWEELEIMGFSKKVMIYSDGYYRVTYNSFNDDAKAKIYLAGIKSNMNDKAWLYRAK
ncbi:MAG: glycosyltransferase [Flavobacteriales bacterium]|nr:glycosyltransferase [Flavobacteriales bacterium]